MGERAQMRQQERQQDPKRHTRRWLIWTTSAVVLGVVLVVGGPWVYAQYLIREAPDPFELTTPEPTRIPMGPIAIDGTWQVAPGSEAGYRMQETLSGQEVTTVGRTDQVTGEVTVQDGVLVAAWIEVDAASISTDESARDSYFRRALDTTTYPVAVFELLDPVDVAAIGESATPITVTAAGNMTIHGITRPATATLQVQRTPDGMEVVGEVPVLLTEYSLSAPDLGWVVVAPEGLVEVRLEFRTP